MTLRHFRHALRGVRTIYRRRGLAYFGYLLDSLRLRMLYRLAWGPDASRPIRAIFEVAGTVWSRAASEAELRGAYLLTDGQAFIRGEIEAGAAANLMDRAHLAGITGLQHAFGNFGRDGTRSLKFTSVPGARVRRPRGAYWWAGRDADRRAFNTRFGTMLLTEAEARRQLAILKARIAAGYRHYAPIDFGGGLTVGQIASTDSGTGRWAFFNGPIVGPLVAGKRVLDLGCNNGSLTLSMLRAGAREIVAIELAAAIADFARFNARVLSWRNACRYELDVITGDMRLWLTQNLGLFDVVTAFCSLYYVPEVDMAAIVRRAAGMHATLVLQANEAITNLPAGADQLARLMKENGYPSLNVFRAADFARPLLVGRP